MTERINQENTQKLGIFGATKSKVGPDFVGIEKDAKQILDKFARALEKVEKESENSKFINKVNEETDFYVEREEFEREEMIASSESEDSEKCRFTGEPDNLDFKNRILENAPQKSEDFIIAEKGSWK